MAARTSKHKPLAILCLKSMMPWKLPVNLPLFQFKIDFLCYALIILVRD